MNAHVCGLDCRQPGCTLGARTRGDGVTAPHILQPGELVDPLPFLELPGSQERLARRIAELTAETMQPGLISGILPADVGAYLRAFPPWVLNPSYLDYGGHQLILKAQLKPELGGMELSLDFDGYYRRWSGTLRAEP